MLTIEWAETNPAQLIRRANLTSMGKRIPENDTWKPTEKWARSIVLSEESTLEYASLIISDDIRGDVAGHVVRHSAYHPRHVLQSSRPDWTNKDRPGPEVKRMYLGKWDIKALIQASKERLCYRAMKETREEFEAIKLYLLNSDDVLMKAVGWSLCPACIYRSDCPFGKRGCGWMNNGFCSDGWDVIEDRYDQYNAQFIREHST